MASKVKDLLVRILGDGADLEKELNSAARNLEAVGRRADRVGKDLSLKVTAPIVAAGGAILAATIKAGQFAGELEDVSARTGIAVGDVQRLQYVSKLLGTEFGALEGAVSNLVRRIPEIEKGGTPAARALQRMGVSLRDAGGELRPMGQILPEIISALQRIENPTERAAAATLVLGRNAQQLAPLLAAGGAEVERLMRRADELGVVLGDDAVRKLALFDDQMDELGFQARTLTADVGLALMPVLKDQLVPFIQSAVVPRLQQWGDVLKSLDADTVKSIASTAGLVALAPVVLTAIGTTASAAAGALRLLSAAGVGLASVVTPGGLLLAGLAIMVGLFADAKIEALQAALALAELRSKVAGLSEEQRQARGRQLALIDIPQLERDLKAAEAKLEGFRADAVKAGLSGSKIAPPGLADASAERDRLKAQLAELRQELGLITQAEVQARTAGASLTTDLAALDDVLAGIGEKEKSVRGVRDVLVDLSRGLDAAAALDASSEAFDQNVLAVSALEGALKELVELGLQPGDAALDFVAETLGRYRAEVAQAAADTERYTEVQRLAAQVIASGQTEQERLLGTMRFLRDEWLQGNLDASTYAQAIEVLRNQIAELNAESEKSKTTAQATGDTWEQQFAAAFVASATNVQLSFRGMAESMLKDIARVIARLVVMRAIMQTLSGFGVGAGSGGITGAIFKIVSAPFGGGKAAGGAVQAGTVYAVGERGMELFRPSTSGTIIPNHALGGGGTSAGAFAAQLVEAMGPIPTVGPPEIAATHVWYRRLISTAIREFYENGGRRRV